MEEEISTFEDLQRLKEQGVVLKGRRKRGESYLVEKKR